MTITQEEERERKQQQVEDNNKDMVISNLRENLMNLSADKTVANSMLDSISNQLIDLLTLVKNQKTILNMSQEDRMKLASQQQRQQQQQQQQRTT